VKGFLFLIFSFFFYFSSFSNLVKKEDSLFHFGVIALSDHNYEVAIGLLEQDVDNEPTFEALYNLSQSYAAIQDWNRAYLSAEKALKISPNNSMAKENVRYTLSNLNSDIVFAHPYSWLQRFVLTIPSVVWYVFGLIASLLTAYFIFIMLTKKSELNTKSYLFALVFLLFALGSYFSGVYKYNHLSKSSFALPIENNTSTYASKSGIELSQVLVKGQRYTIVEESDDWVKLNYPDGQPVWVEKKYVFTY